MKVISKRGGKRLLFSVDFIPVIAVIMAFF